MVDLTSVALPIATFAIGTIVPFAYRYLVHEGYAVRALSVQIVHSPSEQKANNDHFVLFGTLLKVANATEKPLLIEDIVADSFEVNGTRVTPKTVVVAEVKKNDTIYVPLFNSPSAEVETPPLLVKGCEAKTLVVELTLHVPSANAELVQDIARFMQSKKAHLRLKVNGKYRSYAIGLVNPAQVATRYSFVIGDDTWLKEAEREYQKGVDNLGLA